MRIFRKMCAIILSALLLVNVVPTTALAAELGSLSSSEETRIEEFGDSIIYTYRDDEIVFCVQVHYNGYFNFAYIKSGQNKIYESGALRLEEVITGIIPDTLSKATVSDNIDSWSKNMMNKLDNFEVTYSMSCDATVALTDLRESVDVRASSSITDEVIEEYGEDYVNEEIGWAFYTHDGVRYTVYLKESQTTRHVKNAEYAFAAGATVTAIIAWVTTVMSFSAGSISIDWIISAIGAVVATVDAVECIVDAVSGRMYVYQCDRTRTVSVPAYTNTVQYWAGWTLKTLFVYNGSTWDDELFYDVQHHDYEDESGLMQTGFDYFVENNL